MKNMKGVVHSTSSLLRSLHKRTREASNLILGGDDTIANNGVRVAPFPSAVRRLVICI